MVTPAASPEEAAAVAAAIEQFLAETAPAPASVGAQTSPWQRAALEEGISARQVSGAIWGHSPAPRVQNG